MKRIIRQARWRDIYRKLKSGVALSEEEQMKLDRWSYVWMFISIGVSLPIAITALALSLLTILCRP